MGQEPDDPGACSGDKMPAKQYMNKETADRVRRPANERKKRRTA
jgi:hypothetical protein